MCGIAAISLSPSSTIPIRQLAHELLLHSEERGKVASGFAFHYGGGNVYVKDGKPGGHLPLQALPKDARTVIAHTRNATYGNPEENDNNHPVVDDKEAIMLVHNGVITNHEAIRAGEKDVVFPEVDSSVLPWLIREHGIAGLQHIEGWAAVAWLANDQLGTLNLARVQGAAPMVVVYLDDGSIVMGSTFPIIHASLIRVGYGDRITGGYEVPELTHIEVAAGRITGMTNVPKYSSFGAKYKGKTMSVTEKKRLEEITSGKAVDYDAKNPVHAPKTGTVSYGTTPPKTPTPGSLAGAGVTHGPGYQSPYKPQPSAGRPETTSYIDAPPRVERKAGEDPMQAFKRTKEEAPPRKTMPTHAPVAPLPSHPIIRYLEQRLRYWIKWSDSALIDEDLFIAQDYDDQGYLYNAFCDLVADSIQRGLIEEWGVFDKDGKRRYVAWDMTPKEEVDAFIAIAQELPPKPPRSIPKDEWRRGRPLATDESLAEASIEVDAETGELTLVEEDVFGFTDEQWGHMTAEDWNRAFEEYNERKNKEEEEEAG